MKFVYFGTSEFAATILAQLIEDNTAPIAVVTQPDRKAGRGQTLKPSPVKVIAQRHGLRVHQPEKLDAAFLMDMRIYAPDLFVVAAYGSILPKTVLDFPQFKTINVHPSLLPRYRGPSPIQTALLNGDKTTGTTIMLLDEQIDHGPILAKESVAIEPDETSETLEEKLAVVSSGLLLHTMPRWVTHVIQPVEQDHDKATFTNLLTREDGHIQWFQTTEAVEHHIRAMKPWPGSWTRFRDLTVKITHARILDDAPPDQKPGTVLELKNDLLPVVCGDGVLGIERLQVAGRKEMWVKEFVNGHGSVIGSVLM